MAKGPRHSVRQDHLFTPPSSNAGYAPGETFHAMMFQIMSKVICKTRLLDDKRAESDTHTCKDLLFTNTPFILISNVVVVFYYLTLRNVCRKRLLEDITCQYPSCYRATGGEGTSLARRSHQGSGARSLPGAPSWLSA